MAQFDGFPKESFAFLRGLKRNNSKKWFDAHRGDYDDYLLEPAKAFVEAMGARLQTICPEVQPDPRVNGSIRRINRDIRFSKDKSPYKDHLDIHFSEVSGRGCGVSSFFFRLQHDRIYLGAGVYEFSKAALAAYRDAVVGGESGKALRAATGRLKKAGFTVGGAHYKRVPQGYDPEHANVAFLLHKSLYGAQELPVTASTHSGKFVTACFSRYKKLLPLHLWLSEVLSAAR